MISKQANYDIGLRGRLTVGRSQNIAALSAYPFAPYMAHGMGRRVPIIFGASLMIAGTVVQTVIRCKCSLEPDTRCGDRFPRR